MILELNVENIAILERCRLPLGPGFTAMTGETGAGKSLLIDSIQLALGGRADSDLVRAGAARGIVTMTADLTDNPIAKKLCEDLGVHLEDGLLYVQREVSAEGRSTCRIGGRLTPVGVLKQVGELLVDLHGQHDHQSLMDVQKHLGYLDLWIGAEAQTLKMQVSGAFAEWESVRRRRMKLLSDVRERAQRLDLLKFQIREIEAVGPQSGELAEQEGLLSRLANAEKLATAANDAHERLSEAEGCALDQVGTAVRSLESIARLDPSLEDPLRQLQSALYALQDAASGVRAYAEEIDVDPAQHQLVADRVDALRRLHRKYGDDENAILETLARAQEEVELLEAGDANAAELEAAEQQAKEGLELLCGKLSELRQARAKQFSDLVGNELRELAMDKAVFEVRFARAEPTADGFDLAEFFFSANAGEPARALQRIASGGEMSRVMLSLKVVLAGRAGVPTLIFDEVDTGLSGRAAAVVAKKLEQLARHYQVVSISHLPQLAGRATTHFRIEKREVGGRVLTDVVALDGDERVREIARMLAGEEVGESALANARELISQRG
jgi:DNA repair protein RecN (Recombination protein N)